MGASRCPERGAGTAAERCRSTRAASLLDSFSSERPARYGGVVDAIATIAGTPERPLVRADLTVTEGRVRQLTYQKLIGRVDYADEALRIDLRLDQAPGVWLTVAGTVPLGAFDPERSEQPMDLEIASSPIGLGLIEGVTTVVRNVTGSMQVNLTVVGTSRDPHFTGTRRSGGRGIRRDLERRSLQERPCRVSSQLGAGSRRDLSPGGQPRTPAGGHAAVSGPTNCGSAISKSTSRAKGFEVLRNEFGTVDIDSQLTLRGKAESPRLEGAITIVGGTVNVDEILDRTLFRPYSVQAVRPPRAATMRWRP